MSSLRDHLLAIRAEHGELDPAAVVGAATPEDHALHDRFEWDDSIAGHRYRLGQAHDLIQSVRIEYRSGERVSSVRGLLAIPRANSPQPVYEPTEEVMGDDFKRGLVLQQMEREWRLLQSRYGDLAEFAELVRAAAAEVAA